MTGQGQGQGWESSCGIENISKMFFESKNSNFGVGFLGDTQVFTD